MLIAKNVTKAYGKLIAVEDMNMEIGLGRIAVLLGPNGAGKSTTIKCLTGLLRYQGDVTICGFPNKSREAKRLFGYIPETPALYDLLTVQEHLTFVAKAYRLEGYETRMEALLERFQLDDKRDKLARELSKGMQQKLSICCALLPDPQVVFFDEPMVGLDPRAIKELKSVFQELKDRGRTLLISTHIIDSVEGLWDDAFIMNQSRIVVSKSREQIEAERQSLEDLFFQVTEGQEQSA